MKITHNKVGQNLNISDAAKTDKAEKAKGAAKDAKLDMLMDAQAQSSATNVKLSDRAKDIKRIREQINAVPDVDVEKVAKFQKLIDEGKYEVDAEKVADRMVNEHLLTE